MSAVWPCSIRSRTICSADSRLFVMAAPPTALSDELGPPGVTGRRSVVGSRCGSRLPRHRRWRSGGVSGRLAGRGRSRRGRAVRPGASPPPSRAAGGRARRARGCPLPSSADSSCSMAGRSRWFVGSSRTRKLTPSAANAASSARVRSPGDGDDAGRRTRPRQARTWRAGNGPWPGGGRWRRRTSRPRAPGEEPAVLGELADDDARAHPPRPRASGRRPSRASTSVVLPDPFGPDEADALGPADVEVERAEGEGRPLDHGVLQPGHESARPRASRMAKRRSQPSQGLSTTSSDSSARSVRRALRPAARCG